MRDMVSSPGVFGVEGDRRKCDYQNLEYTPHIFDYMLFIIHVLLYNDTHILPPLRGYLHVLNLGV